MRKQIDTPVSILSVFGPEDVIMEPYPHILAKDVLTDTFLQKLMDAFPSTSKITKSQEYPSNKRFDYTIEDLRKDTDIEPVFREFIEAQADKDFYNDFIRIFGAAIEKYYPGKIKKDISLGTRWIDSHDDVDLLADAHISINTPVTTKPTSVRSSHVDDPKKMYGGLFYMRLPEDDSTGGNLQISKFKNPSAKFFGQTISDTDVTVVQEVPYRANTFVFFLNTIDSIHGVTPRSVTKHRRQFINLVAELKEPLFDIQSRQQNIWIKRAKVFLNKFAR